MKYSLPKGVFAPVLRIALLFFWSATALNAQLVFPVSLTTQTVPPLSGTLADWATPGSNRLAATMLLLDAFEPSYQVRLKISIEGNGVLIRTRETMAPRPITLRYGVPQRIEGSNLAEYLQLDNLEFAGGFTREQYVQNGTLPEGLYTVCIQAFDYDRFAQKALSAPSCTGFFYQRFDPPVVLIPNGVQTPNVPQNLAVQWQPRHGGGFPPEYTVQIFEYTPQEITPQQIIQVNQPFAFKTVNNVNSTFFTVADPLLVSGRRYIVRVRVRDVTNRNLFHNDGWSEPVVFQYGEGCPQTFGLRAEAITQSTARLRWNPRPGFVDSYVVSIKLRAFQSAPWYDYTSPLPRLDLNDLEPGTIYEAKVKTICTGGGGEGAYSDTINFKTLIPPAEQFFDCTTPNSIPQTTNRTNTQSLKFGDVVTIGGFKCRIVSAKPSSQGNAAAAGAWEGFGQIIVPWFKDKGKVNCRFNNIMVNTDMVVYDGNIVGMDARNIRQIMDSLQLASLKVDSLNFCGQAPFPKAPREALYQPDFWNQLYGSNTSTYFVPFNPTINTPPPPNNTYDRFNPNNAVRPYDPMNYGDPNNPYTPQNPFNPYSPYNPYNVYNPYNPSDYSDPANPYSAANPYNPANIARLDSLVGLSEPMPGLFDLSGVNMPLVNGDTSKRYALLNLRFTPNGAVLDAVLRAKVKNQYLVFKANNIGFHPGGLLGQARLYLGEDYVVESKGKVKMTIKGGLNTWAGIDCNGFAGFSLGGSLTFCHDVALPVDIRTGKPKLLDTIRYQNAIYPQHSYVTGSFSVTMIDTDEFTGSISISPFTLARAPGWVFTVQEAYFDFSDTRTPASLNFPIQYTHPDLLDWRVPAQSPKWEGVTIKRIQVFLPRKSPFSKRNTTDQLSFGATDIVVDERGITGDFFAKNLIALNEGRLSTWSASVDSVNISILVNQFRSFTVKGMLAPNPVDDTIGYSCMIQPGGKYIFALRVVSTKEYNVSALRSKFQFFNNSSIAITYNDETDDLYGNFLINGRAMFFPKTGSSPPPPNNAPPGPNEKDVVRVPYIQVQGLEFTTREPYILNAGAWQFSGGSGQAPPQVSGFPLTIRQAGLVANQQQSQVAFIIAAAVNLTNQSEQGLKAEGAIRIICDVSLNQATGRQDWRFNRVMLDSLVVDYSAPGYKVKGKIIMFQHNVAYGSGFQGSMQAIFEPSIRVQVGAMYGKMENYNYFFLDAYASFPAGIPLGATGLAVYGFGGGAYYHMQRSIPVTNIASPYGLTATNPGTGLGYTIDGGQYIPNPQILFGIKAKIGLGAVKKELFNSEVIFEVNFNNSGGINQIAFRGEGRFMQQPAAPNLPPSEPSLRVVVDMIYSVPAETFHCTSDIFVNVNGGVLTGAYPAKRAGKVEIHYDPEDWYINIGTPQKRIMLSYSLAPLKKILPNQPPPANPGDTSLVSIDWSKVGILMTGYLNAGTILPPFPDPPEEVLQALQYGTWTPMSTSQGNGGVGVMFGAGFHIKTPEMGFSVFFAQLQAGAGFDVLLRNYGSNAYCEGSAPPLGVNGWYATGQLWGYLIGKMGIKVSLMGKSRRFTIFSIAAGAVLQAKLPNPLWARGMVGGTYSILSGLYKGRCRYEFEVGTDCVIMGGSPLGDVELIGSTTPRQGVSEVDVFVRPQATFNLPIGRVFEIEEDDNVKYYVAQLVRFELRDHTGAVLPGETKWNTDKDVVAFTPTEILAGQKQHQLFVHLNFEKSDNGVDGWTIVTDNGQTYVEKAEPTFTTGDAPDYIPHHNVAYTYPVRNQANFHKQESALGYVQLIQGQSYLFKGQPNCTLDPTRWDQKAFFLQGNNVIDSTSNITYNAGAKRVVFPIPVTLPNNSVMQLSLLNVPKGPTQALDANVITQVTNLIADTAADPATVLKTERLAQGLLTELKAKELYMLHFRTSLYPTFAAKVDAIKTTQYWEAPMGFSTNNNLFISQFGMKFNGPEFFDPNDLQGKISGDYQVRALVRPEARLSQTADNWYNNGVLPGMYAFLPNANIPFPTGRPDTTVLGRVPMRGDVIRVRYASAQMTPTELSESHILSWNYPLDPAMTADIAYRPQYYMKLDEWGYEDRVANWLTQYGSIPPQWSNFLNWNMPPTPEGFYTIKLKYFLPGEATHNSEKDIQVKLDLNGN
jgi:hypothetical protein